MAKNDIRKANSEYEAWLRKQLRGDVVESDLAAKHEKMSAGPFPFLRATYWRWAETILTICPDLAKAPTALAVGDIHLENYGTWRDLDGRLVWGVNDFDEAATMPYVLDLVRLATSATLAKAEHPHAADDICAAILAGYNAGLAGPRPFVLEEYHAWLRALVVVPEAARARFWEKLDKLKPPNRPPQPQYVEALRAAMPDRRVKFAIRRRTAGAGSLGRPRFVGVGNWRGGPVVREAKALVPSAWVRAHGRGSSRLRVTEIAHGAYRDPDPWYNVLDSILVRRLSPNNRKIAVEEMPREILAPKMLAAMAYELASVHLGTGDRRAAIARDFAARQRHWLRDATDAASAFVVSEYKAWCKG